mgnify:FL=1
MYKIYTTLSCGYCHMAKDMMKDYNMKYTEVVLNNPNSLREFKTRTKHTTVPQIYKIDEDYPDDKDGEYIGGYDALVKYIHKGNAQ